MADNTKTKTVNYRRCALTPPSGLTRKPGESLQDWVEKAKRKLPKPWIRKIGIGGERNQFLFTLSERQGCLSGCLVLCEDNKMIPLVDADAQGNSWEDVVEPMDATGTRRKLQEQTLFFAIREDHVAILQTKELSISDLRDFLIWFIQSKAKLATGWEFDLQNLPSKKAVEKLRDHNIKSVRIGRQAFWMEKTEVPTAQATQRKRFTKVLKTDPLIFGFLKEIVRNDALIEQLEKSDDPGSVFVALEITYRSRSEKRSQNLVREIAATFGDMPELSPEIKLDGKSKIKGDELTIMGQVDIQCPGGNLSKEDAMTRVVEWLLESIKSGKVLV